MWKSLARWFDVEDRMRQFGADRPCGPDAVPIEFKPTLIHDLTADHRQLMDQLGALRAAHARGDLDTCMAKMKLFTSTLRAHLLKENLHLYLYLKHAFQGDGETAQRVAELRQEMQRIGLALNDFVARYTSTLWDEETRRQLGSELKKTGDMLSHRIQQEEQVLYPLYRPY